MSVVELVREAQVPVAWKPLPGSQVLALSCPANHILFEGTRGPGKTDTQIMRFYKRVGRGYGRFWRGVIFDREYKNLDDVISKAERWFNMVGDGAKFSGGGGGGRWRWPTGEVLLFRHIKRRSDYAKYHGHEYPYIGWNELTKYPTSEMYDLMMSCNRSSFRPADYPVTIDGDIFRETGRVVFLPKDSYYAEEYILPEMPLEVFSTTNPHGPGHNWVKRRFIDCAEPGEIVRREIEVFNPRTKKREIVTKTQVRIFGSYMENEYLSPEYIAELETMADQNIRKAWLQGDWDVVAGGIFDDIWRRDKHVIPRFKIPKSWHIDRSHDWGSQHPFWVGWWAEANGETVETPRGPWTPRRGSLILINEWYGTQEIGTNKGIRLSAKNVARGILEREEKMRFAKWINRSVLPGPADNEIHNIRDTGTDSIAKIMSDHHVEWENSDKSAGSRRNGVQLFRDRLEAAITGEGPAIYFMQNCEAAIATIPILPRDEKDEDDVDTAAEDHPWDGVRYRVLKGANRLARSLSITRPR